MEKNKVLRMVSITVALLLCCSVFWGGTAMNVKAAKKVYTVYSQGRISAEQSGNYLFFAMSQKESRLFRYDTKSHALKKILSKGGYGFSNIEIKGNHVYFVWNAYYGTDNTDYYICRVDKDGKHFKKLCKGSLYTISGNRIYFKRMKKVTSYGVARDTDIGTYSMSLTGTGIKSEPGVAVNLKQVNTISNTYGSLILSGSESYGVANKNLYFKSAKTGGKKLIASHVDRAAMAGKYIIYVQDDTSQAGAFSLRISRNDGRFKKKVTTGFHAGSW